MRSKLIFVRWSDTRLSCIAFQHNRHDLISEVTWISVHSSRFRNEFHILEIDRFKFLVNETRKVLKSSHLQGQTTDAKLTQKMKYYDIANTLICSLCCQELSRTVPYNYRYESFLTELLYQPANSSAQVKSQNITLDCGQWAYRCWIILL
jgi:hypothetical protein